MKYKQRGKKKTTHNSQKRGTMFRQSFQLFFYAECVERETIYIYCILLFIFIGSVTILKIGIEE